MQRRVILGGLALAVAGAAGWTMLRGPETGAPMAALAQEGAPDTSLVKEMALGAADAPVTVVEYASFTCPHCANFHAEVFDRIKTNYIDTGKVRFIYREIYFDRPGLWASMVARCGDGSKFFPIAGLIYEKQRSWTAAADAAGIAANLRTIGKTAGFSDEQLDACLSDAALAQALVAVEEENRTRDGIDSTPSFLIDGQKYSNMSYEDFARVLDEKIGG